ncbi:MAG: transaldolase [Caldilineaceae bacterium]|nr:transaldolase [Caldilineaceae bacterium]
MNNSQNRLQQLNQAGQSIWFDYIERSMVQSGKLAQLMADGITGVTSNPTIFQQAITGSDAYTQDVQELAAMGKDAKGIFEALAVADIQAATEVLHPVYVQTQSTDGFVSIEVSPDLADETEATIAEARRLWQAVDRPNLMIKVPATKAGLGAIEQLISEGINVNVTLIFSLDRYADVKEAYIHGLEKRLAAGGSIAQVASVASFFVSRVDAKIDPMLEKIAADNANLADQAKELMGKAAIANAKLAYAQFQTKFGITEPSTRWQKLADADAQVQRPLWASTSTKNPAYSDVLYVDTLIGPHTVNTMPPATVDAFKDHGTVARTVDANVSQAQAEMDQLAQLGINMTQVTDELEREGVQKFADSYHQLLSAIETQLAELTPAD